MGYLQQLFMMKNFDSTSNVFGGENIIRSLDKIEYRGNLNIWMFYDELCLTLSLDYHVWICGVGLPTPIYF